jgi:hypothetical protein
MQPFPKGNVPWNKGIEWLEMRGKNHPNWKPIRYVKMDRMVCEYKEWRKQIMSDYDYTCFITGNRGGKIQAHHMLNFSQYPELRTDIQNGICFSIEIHRMFHSFFGKQNNTIEQVIEYYFLMNLYKLLD